MNAGVVAQNFVRHLLRHSGQQREVEPRLQFGQKALSGPAFFEEEVLHACALAIFAQALLIAKDLRNCANHADGLMRQDEGVQANCKMRFGGESASDAQRVADFAVEFHRRQADIVDLRISAPRGAAGNGDLEFARKIVELRVCLEQVRNLGGQRRGVNELIGGDPGQRAAGHVAHHVAAGAFGRESDRVECVHDLGQRFDGEPVKLNVLPDGNVGQVARVLASERADDAKLAREDDAVGNADAHHEVIGDQAFAAFATGGAYAVALGVDAPPLEIGGRPLRYHAGAAFACKGAHLVKGLPGIFLALQALSFLGLGLFDFSGLCHGFLWGEE